MLTINTPGNVFQCLPTQIEFTGGTGPFSLSINSPDATGNTIQTYDDITSSPFQWSTNVSAGISLGLSITDLSNGIPALSGQFLVGDSGNNSCLKHDGSSVISVGSSMVSSIVSAPSNAASGPSSASGSSHIASSAPGIVPSGASTAVTSDSASQSSIQINTSSDITSSSVFGQSGVTSVSSSGITASSGSGFNSIASTSISGSASPFPNPPLISSLVLNTNSHHLSGGAIGGIITGAIIVLLLTLFGILIKGKRKGQQHRKVLFKEMMVQPYTHQIQTIRNTPSPTMAHPVRRKPPPPSPQPEESSLPSQSPQHTSETIESNPVTPTVETIGSSNERTGNPRRGTHLVAEPTLSTRLIERITRAILYETQLRRTDIEEQPPRYEE
ncbi:hypothetical protein BDY19DRAFT_635830 [Irpex rosettiformis]|uniref:Uncharacterized protein n=1 Tax=Irpex rosettiformis TaxID=378272 RepID=A0ACB8UBH1_9APHY|nr:hypothetical protein BDY19DRAFT_635830 [Irpex rosettiformis]